MLDDTLLADPSALVAADSTGVLRAAATAGAQVRAAAHAAHEAGVGLLAGTRPRALVLLRRPGAAESSCALLAALLGPATPVPVVVATTTPAWVGPLDVLYAHTAEPDDAELADGVARAVGRGAEVVLSAPADGPVAAAGAGRALLVEPRIPVPPGLDLPQALATGLAVLAALGLVRVPAGPPEEAGAPQDRPAPGDGYVDVGGPLLERLADQLDAEAERNQPAHEPFVNPAKAMALRLDGHTPLLWGADPLAVAVAGHGAATLATHAGVVAHAADVTTGIRAAGLLRALERTAGGADVFHDPFDDPPQAAAPPARLLLLGTDEQDPQQEALRRTGRPLPVADVVHPVDEVPRGTPAAALLRAALLVSRLDTAAVYLGLAAHEGS